MKTIRTDKQIQQGMGYKINIQKSTAFFTLTMKYQKEKVF